METTPILLDTSVNIDFLRRKNKSKSIFFKLIPEYEFHISVITIFEIKIGVRTRQQHRDYDILMENIEVLPVDQICIDHAASIYNSSRQKNALIEFADLLIAATALSNSLALATLNKKHFQRIHME